MIIQLCTFSDGNNETWITCKNIKALSAYFTSSNYYRQLLIVVKNRQSYFRGYKLRYIE